MVVLTGRESIGASCRSPPTRCASVSVAFAPSAHAQRVSRGYARRGGSQGGTAVERPAAVSSALLVAWRDDWKDVRRATSSSAASCQMRATAASGKTVRNGRGHRCPCHSGIPNDALAASLRACGQAAGRSSHAFPTISITTSSGQLRTTRCLLGLCRTFHTVSAISVFQATSPQRALSPHARPGS